MFAFLKIKLSFYRRFVIYKVNTLKSERYIKKARNGIRNKDFSIISNNCWGGSIYEDLGLNYTTPTIGLFFFAPCYIKFASDLKKYISSPLQFTEKSKYEKGNHMQGVHSYPIGILDNDIEIHFLHYKTKEEALEKWNRRKERINFDNLYLSFTDNEVCTTDEIKTFDNLPYKKVFFSAKPIDGVQSLVFIKSFKGMQGVGNMYDNRWHHRKYFDVVKWLNN